MKIQVKKGNAKERGGVLVLVAVCLTLFLICLALAVDFGLIVYHRGQLNSVSDAAVLAAARELIDEDALTGLSNQVDDITAARDYTEMYASLNRNGFALDRNDDNKVSGGVKVGYIQDPLDMDSPLITNGFQVANSIEVTASQSNQINGPLKLLLGAFTGTNEVEVAARSTATIENRIAGFQLREGETLPMLPMVAYEDSWNNAFDGVSDFDQYNVDPSTGEVTPGSDGIPEFLYAPFYPKQGIPGHDGNGRTSFITDTVSAEYIANQIKNGMTKSDLESNNADGMKLTKNAFGKFAKWVPGQQWMDISWHNALNNIKGQKRIIPLFKSLSESQFRPLVFKGTDEQLFQIFNGVGLPELPEQCSSANEWYEIVGFQGVTVCESFWPDEQKLRRVYLQPAQMIINSAVIDSEMKSSKTVFTLSLTR